MFIFGIFLIFSSSTFSRVIVDTLPVSFKNSVKNTIFYFPIKLRDVFENNKKISELNLQVRELNTELDVLRSKINSGQVSNEIVLSSELKKFELKKIFVDYSLPPSSKKMNKKNGYLELYNDKIIVIFWTGKIIYFDKKQISNKEIIFHNIKTNINNFLKNDEKDKFISIKDAMILNDKLYLSYTKNVKPKSNCLNLSLVSAKINENDNKLTLEAFEDFFTYDECLEARFNGYQSGGRIFDYKDNTILLSIGDFQNFTPAQDENSYFGKIISIDVKNKTHKIISMGHRNQQGLYYDKEQDVILSTEHGQRGGDEINKIIDSKNEISNYGWPVASYSTYYGYEDKRIKQIAPFKKSHKDNGFIEPLIYFTPALGISQITHANNFEKFDKSIFLVTSMAKRKIVFVNINYNENVAKKIDELFINERIRDIIPFEEDKYLLFLETSPAIGILKNIDEK